jgi:DNA-binding transcriptional MocR family regulator
MAIGYGLGLCAARCAMIMLLLRRPRLRRQLPSVCPHPAPTTVSARQLCSSAQGGGATVAAAAAGARLSERSRELAAGGGAAAQVWEQCNALASQPGMINMGQGFPDFEGSAIARQVAASALSTGEAALNQYSPQPGLLALRESVAAFHSRRYGAEHDPGTEVIVTAGAQEALAASFSAFLDPVRGQCTVSAPPDRTIRVPWEYLTSRAAAFDLLLGVLTG